MSRNGNEKKEDSRSARITRGLGGKSNIRDVDCCATRLRCTVEDPSLVDEKLLRGTGASGVIRSGNGLQIIYGPNVTVVKSELEDYLAWEQEKEDRIARPDTEPLYTNEERLQSEGLDNSVKTEKSVVEKMPEVKYDKKECNDRKPIVISSPLTGVAAALDTVPDEAFAQKMMGDGAVVTPMDPMVLAPEDGEVTFVFDTKHAVGFLTDSGMELLIHVGIDTVNLQGKGFETLVTAGQKVKKGAPLLKLDLDYLKKHARSMATPIVCTELEEARHIRLLREGEITAGEGLFVVE